VADERIVSKKLEQIEQYHGELIVIIHQDVIWSRHAVTKSGCHGPYPPVWCCGV